jgi:Xaa-Pro aminopeptidase
MANRLSLVRRRLPEYDADAILVSYLPNVRWACGFTGSNGLLLVGLDEAFFVTDGRYTEQARHEVDGAKVAIAENGLLSRLAELNAIDDRGRVVFQADHVTVARGEKLKEHLPETDWVGKTDVLTPLVAKKEDSEVDQIRESQQITEAVFDHVLSLLEPGVTEREIAAEITYQHLKRGADEMSFDPIVASGPNGARPHARPTDRTLRGGELVVLDMGGIRTGYASDMTRTVSLGPPSDAAHSAYDVVRTAQEKALDAARAGLTGKQLDAVARDTIEEAGLADFFSHGLGHGIGLEVHEWPRVSRTVDDELPVGACVTIEPGVYVPEKGFGIRIEDIVVLREDGCENLTSTPKDLRIL